MEPGSVSLLIARSSRRALNSAGGGDLPPPAGYYASPSGSSTANGDINHPWDLQTALSGGYPSNTVQPGDTVWLRGGTYTPTGGNNEWQSTVSGSLGSGVDDPGGKIQFRGYPGEWPIVATPNPNTDHGGTPILGISSNYCWFRDFEIMSPNTSRVSAQSGLPGDIPWSGAATSNTGWGVGTKMIHLITHDTGGGPGYGNDASNAEIYGCINFNHGWEAPDRGHGHNTYSRNVTGWKKIRKSINWGNCDISMQIYADTLASISLLENILYMAGGLDKVNGAPHGGGGYKANIQFGGGLVATDGVISENCTYNPWGQSGQCYDEMGSSAGIQPCTYQNNYIASGDIFAAKWVYTLSPGISDSNLTMTGCHVYGRYITPQTPPYGPYDTPSYGSPPIDDASRFGNAAYNNTFYGTTQPTTNYIRVYPVNDYETGRGHVAVYNWENLTTVNVNISSFMPNGSNWAAYHGQNPLAAAVATGSNYQGGTITLPMTAGGGLTVAAPLGFTACPASFPQFAAFIIRKTN